jgi:hypothetical protein
VCGRACHTLLILLETEKKIDLAHSSKDKGLILEQSNGILQQSIKGKSDNLPTKGETERNPADRRLSAGTDLSGRRMR